jgi:hypothetical protein
MNRLIGGKSSVSYTTFIDLMAIPKNKIPFATFISNSRNYLSDLETNVIAPYGDDYTPEQMLEWKTEFNTAACYYWKTLFPYYPNYLDGDLDITNPIFKNPDDVVSDVNKAIAARTSSGGKRKKSKMSGGGEYHDDTFYLNRINQMRVQPKWNTFRASFPAAGDTAGWNNWFNTYPTRQQKYDTILYFIKTYLDGGPDNSNFDGLLDLTNATN